MDNETQANATQEYQCPNCQAILETDTPLEGKQILCPECGQEFVAMPKSKLRIIRPSSPSASAPPPSCGKPSRDNSNRGRSNNGLWFFLGVLVVAGLLAGAWFAGIIPHNRSVTDNDEPALTDQASDSTDENLADETSAEVAPQEKPAPEPPPEVEAPAETDILAFAPLKAALEAARDNPTGANYKKLDEVWSNLPDEQKTATQEPVMSAICAMLLSRGNPGAAAKRQSLINYRALLDAVMVQCRTCGGAGRSSETCRTCGGTGIRRSRCDTCKGTGKCPRCGGKGGQTQRCSHCHGQGKYTTSVSKENRTYRKAVHWVTCPQCNGKGRLPQTCAQCRGSGRCPSCSGHPNSERPCGDCHGGTTSAACRTCNGAGRIASQDKCKSVIDAHIEKALRICHGED